MGALPKAILSRALVWGAMCKKKMERRAGIEPAASAWKAEVLPLYERRMSLFIRENLQIAKGVLNSSRIPFTPSECFDARGV